MITFLVGSGALVYIFLFPLLETGVPDRLYSIDN